jgi:hypothetical protein
MDTIIQPSFTVGVAQGPYANGSIVNHALGPHAEGLVSQLEGKFRAAVKAGSVFFGCNQAATTTTIALAATYTGIVVYNPITSAKNLSILNVSCSLWAAPAGIVSVGLLGGWAATGVVTHTTPLVAYGAKSFVVGGGLAGVDSAATLVGTPIWLRMLNAANTSAVLTVANCPVSWDIDGAYEVPPGGYLAIGTQTVASIVGSIMWREVEP